MSDMNLTNLPNKLGLSLYFHFPRYDVVRDKLYEIGQHCLEYTPILLIFFFLGAGVRMVVGAIT